jgi:hypothetical protein
MLTRPIYESLPYGYMTVGSSSFVILDQLYAILAAVVMFAIGAKIYNLRSENRRTDDFRRRKFGRIPDPIYGILPFCYFFTATAIFKFSPTDSGQFLALCLACYALFILFRRASYRRHKVQNTSRII